MEPYELSITEASERLADKELSSVELTSSCLARIDKTEERINSFISLDSERALARAEAADRERAAGTAGLLCGIPLAIKDLLCTKDRVTTCGSKILENFTPPYDATVVEKLDKQGAVIVGKATMDEFAMGSTSENCAFNIPSNPWNTDYIAGGSSGGSATSVASGQVLGSLGSDTGGSIRLPASLCGIVGMKPTYGRVSRYGLVAFASSLDQIGPLTRNVADCAVMMQSICGYDRRDSTSVDHPVEDYSSFLAEGLKGVRVGVPREYFGDGLDAEVRAVVLNGIEVLRAAGADIVDVSIPKDTRSAGFGPEMKRRILIGTYALSSGYYDAYYKKASQVRSLILEDFRKAWESCDVLVSPVAPTPAWKKGEKVDDPLAMYLSDIFTLSTNLAGLPGLSVPGGFSSNGLPIGIQLQGPHFHEGALIKCGFNLERGLNLETTIPAL
ncbi:MAG: amidase family protein [Desulfuromonadales bacterium]